MSIETWLFLGGVSSTERKEVYFFRDDMQCAVKRHGFADTAKPTIQRRPIVMQDVTLKNEAPIGLDRYELEEKAKTDAPFDPSFLLGHFERLYRTVEEERSISMLLSIPLCQVGYESYLFDSRDFFKHFF